jgi:hypothetical protein
MGGAGEYAKEMGASIFPTCLSVQWVDLGNHGEERLGTLFPENEQDVGILDAPNGFAACVHDGEMRP